MAGHGMKLRPSLSLSWFVGLALVLRQTQSAGRDIAMIPKVVLPVVDRIWASVRSAHIQEWGSLARFFVLTRVSLPLMPHQHGFHRCSLCTLGVDIWKTLRVLLFSSLRKTFNLAVSTHCSFHKNGSLDRVGYVVYT